MGRRHAEATAGTRRSDIGGRASEARTVPAAPPAPERAQGPQHAVAQSRRTAPTAVTQPQPSRCVTDHQANRSRQPNRSQNRAPASTPRLALLCTPQTGLSSGTSSASILCIIGVAVEPGRSEACRARSKCGPAPRRCRRDGHVVAASACRTLVPLADHQAGDGLGRRQRVAAEGL
jgi:hypothetical protein